MSTVTIAVLDPAAIADPATIADPAAVADLAAVTAVDLAGPIELLLLQI